MCDQLTICKILELRLRQGALEEDGVCCSNPRWKWEWLADEEEEETWSRRRRAKSRRTRTRSNSRRSLSFDRQPCKSFSGQASSWPGPDYYELAIRPNSELVSKSLGEAGKFLVASHCQGRGRCTVDSCQALSDDKDGWLNTKSVKAATPSGYWGFTVTWRHFIWTAKQTTSAWTIMSIHHITFKPCFHASVRVCVCLKIRFLCANFQFEGHMYAGSMSRPTESAHTVLCQSGLTMKAVTA